MIDFYYLQSWLSKYFTSLQISLRMQCNISVHRKIIFGDIADKAGSARFSNCRSTPCRKVVMTLFWICDSFLLFMETVQKSWAYKLSEKQKEARRKNLYGAMILTTSFHYNHQIIRSSYLNRQIIKI